MALHWNSQRREREKLEDALPISTKTTWRVVVRHRWQRQRQRTFDWLRRRVSARIFFAGESYGHVRYTRAVNGGAHFRSGRTGSKVFRCEIIVDVHHRRFAVIPHFARHRLNHLRNQINIEVLVKKKDPLKYLDKYISGANKSFVKNIANVKKI